MTPLVLLWLKRGGATSETIRQRRGIVTKQRQQSPLIWLHGASRGETMGLTSIIQHLQALYPDATFLITTSSISAAAVVHQMAPHAIHQLLPLDHPFFVKRFLHYWRPSLVFWTESDFWPSLFRGIQKRRIPFFLINGRLSSKTYRGWRWAKPLLVSTLKAFTTIYAQTYHDQSRFLELGLSNVIMLGNIKFFISPLSQDQEAQDWLRSSIQGRPLFMTASTHPGEEILLLPIYLALQKKWPHLLWFLIPRHPHRLPELTVLCKQHHLTFAIRSRKDPLCASTSIYIADTFGEMGTFYGFASFVILGGSFLPIGGHTPVEPALADCVVITGPETFKNTEVFATLEQEGAIIVTPTLEDLKTTLEAIYGKTLSLEPYRQAARHVLSRQKDLQKDLLEALTAQLPKDLSS